jgi:hypothetical protein
MKATLLPDGYIELVSETEEERAVLNVIADEGIDLAGAGWGVSVTSIKFRRTYLANLQTHAVEGFRDAMLDQITHVRFALEGLADKLEGMWGDTDAARLAAGDTQP